MNNDKRVVRQDMDVNEDELDYPTKQYKNI